VGSALTAVSATRVGPVNSRVRAWFRTGGGGEDAVGAAQRRRNVACGLLTQVRERVGDDAYEMLARSIKACYSGNQVAENVLRDVKSTAEIIMKSHPDLLERFITFLPKEEKRWTQDVCHYAGTTSRMAS
jgi:histone deacetylase complex regulatory component SIN3